MLGVTSSIDPKLITKDYGGKKIKIKAMPKITEYKGTKSQEKYTSKKSMARHEKMEGKEKEKSEEKGTKGLFSKSNKLPFMVKIKMAAAMNKKSKKC